MSRRFCFLHVYDYWLHQSGLDCSANKVVLFADFRRSLHQIPAWLKHHTTFYQYGRASQALVNTLHNVYVVEELIQLSVASNAEIIANLHWTEDLTLDFSLEYFQGCGISA